MAHQTAKNATEMHEPQKLLAAPRPLPLLEAKRPLVPDAEFSRWFRLLFTAVSHEVGNSLSVFLLFSSEKGGLRRGAIHQLFDGYIRIGALMELAKGDTHFASLASMRTLFPEGDRRALGIENGAGAGNTNVWGLKRIAAGEIKKFMGALEELGSAFREHAASSDAERRFHFNRAIRFGGLLCGCLEKLMADELDFEAEKVELAVGDASNGSGSSISAKWDAVAEANGCRSGYGAWPEGLKDARVVANPVFCTLIFENICLNAKRAMLASGLEPVIGLSAERGPGKVALRFSNRGKGMGEDVMRRLNEGEQVTTREGTDGVHGIGFSYCRELAALMGGRLYVECSGDEGTTIALELKSAP